MQAAAAAFTDANGHQFAQKYISGVEFGASGQLRGEKLAVQASVLYSQKGFRLAEEYQLPSSGRGYVIQESYHFQCLTLPLNLVYSPHAHQQGWQAYAGGYLGVALGGQYSFDNRYLSPQPNGDTYTSMAWGEKAIAIGEANNISATAGAARRFDAGVQAGLGFRRGNVQAQLGYSLGLVNQAQVLSPNALVLGPATPLSYKHRAIQATATYWFGATDKQHAPIFD